MKFDFLYSAIERNDELSNQINRIYQRIMRMNSNLETIYSPTSLTKSVELLIRQSSEIVDRLSAIEERFHLPEYMSQAISRAVEVSTPYVGSEALENLIVTSTKTLETIEPQTESNALQKHSSFDIFSVISTWLSILVTIYCTILSSLPNNQLDRIAAQNDVIIAQQEEILEMQEDDQDLQNTLYTLSNAIDLLTEEVETLRDELEHMDDPSIQEERPDLSDGQQQDGDTQE